jgi:hypothetical protein
MVNWELGPIVMSYQPPQVKHDRDRLEVLGVTVDVFDVNYGLPQDAFPTDI